jgi:ABC-type transport system involved in multi-copper enzyme maturation permease subunit
MKRNTHDSLLSFLGGASWAFAIVGTWVTFQSFIFLGFVTALLFAFLFLFIALFSIVVLENLSMSRDRHDESLKQTAILIEIRDAIHSTSSQIRE